VCVFVCVCVCVCECMCVCMCVCVCVCVCMTHSTEISTPQNLPNRETSISRFKFKLYQKSRFEFVPGDTEESAFLDLVDFTVVVFSVECCNCDM